MAATHFSGPLRAGEIRNTTGTTLGSNVANVGSVVLSQAANITQTTGLLTDIVIPANSTIVDIKIYVRTAWTGVATTFGIGTSVSDTALTAAAALDGAAIGPLTATPGTDGTRNATWVDVGTTDIRVKIVSTNAGSGVGTVVVTYVQNINLL